MDKLREFQANQRARKDELEKLIKQERFQLEQKHRIEKTELELKHARIRAQFKSELIVQREQRSNEKEQKKTAKRKANIEDELFDLLCQEDDQKWKKQKTTTKEIVLDDITNKLLTFVNNQIIEKIDIGEANAHSTQEIKTAKETDPFETLDLCTFNPTQMAEDLFKIN